ncbi:MULTISPECIES: hypothetical protein [unclassified Pseudomonas]|uniref:hypothetical protein n=1 Tax=unclassified Pseudomonas TaxID=196821 RepID=UPI0025EE5FC5|nr:MULTISPECIES: hypothetical protein [unclassified Pseudomonas]
MLNGNEWQQLHGDFFSETHHMVDRADECLSHLELIGDDKDAIECLLGTLQLIAGKADAAALPSIAGFARQLRHLLYAASVGGRLLPKALEALRECLSLLSWQVELVDPFTGLLPLDDSEQQLLLEQFGCYCAVSRPKGIHAVAAQWSVPVATNPAGPGIIGRCER